MKTAFEQTSSGCRWVYQHPIGFLQFWADCMLDTYHFQSKITVSCPQSCSFFGSAEQLGLCCIYGKWKHNFFWNLRFFLAVPYLAVSVISHVSYYKCFEIKLSHIPVKYCRETTWSVVYVPVSAFVFFGLLVCFYHIVLGSNQTNNCALVLFAGLNKNLWAGGKKMWSFVFTTTTCFFCCFMIMQ